MWHHQRFSLSRTQSSNPLDLMWTRQGEEKEKDHRLIRATPSIQMLGISKGTGHTAGKEQMYGLCVHRILTHVDGVRPTQSSDPASGIPWPLVRTPCLFWAPKVEMSVPITPWDGRKKCGFGLLSPHLSWEVLVSSLWFSAILTVSTAVIIMLNTLPWFWQARSFLVPLRCWKNMPDAGLGDEGRVCSLLSRDGHLEGDHSSNLTCCSLAFCLIHVPCNQFTRWTCLPTKPEGTGKMD